VSILFEPCRIGAMEVKNRFVRSATYFGLSDEDGYVGERSVELMRTLARNEVGLIVTGYAFVAQSGQVFADMNGIDADEQIPGYRRMTEAVHDVDRQLVVGGLQFEPHRRTRGRRQAIFLESPAARQFGR